MKQIKISDDIHTKLTALLGELTAQTSRMQTYQDAINALLKESVMLPPELIQQAQAFVEENRQFGFTTKEELIRDAIRVRLDSLKKNVEYVEFPREEYDELDQAVKEMDTPFRSADDFIHSQANEVLEKYQEFKKSKQSS